MTPGTPQTGTPNAELLLTVLHCHIFNHAELGLMTELVVLPRSTKQEP